jgi:hypothetical protein
MYRVDDQMQKVPTQEERMVLWASDSKTAVNEEVVQCVE